MTPDVSWHANASAANMRAEGHGDDEMDALDETILIERIDALLTEYDDSVHPNSAPNNDGPVGASREPVRSDAGDVQYTQDLALHANYTHSTQFREAAEFIKVQMAASSERPPSSDTYTRVLEGGLRHLPNGESHNLPSPTHTLTSSLTPTTAHTRVPTNAAPQTQMTTPYHDSQQPAMELSGLEITDSRTRLPNGESSQAHESVESAVHPSPQTPISSDQAAHTDEIRTATSSPHTAELSGLNTHENTPNKSTTAPSTPSSTTSPARVHTTATTASPLISPTPSFIIVPSHSSMKATNTHPNHLSCDANDANVVQKKGSSEQPARTRSGTITRCREGSFKERAAVNKLILYINKQHNGVMLAPLIGQFYRREPDMREVIGKLKDFCHKYAQHLHYTPRFFVNNGTTVEGPGIVRTSEAQAAFTRSTTAPNLHTTTTAAKETTVGSAPRSPTTPTSAAVVTPVVVGESRRENQSDGQGKEKHAVNELVRFIDQKHGGNMISSYINQLYAEKNYLKHIIGKVRLFCDKHTPALTYIPTFKQNALGHTIESSGSIQTAAYRRSGRHAKSTNSSPDKTALGKPDRISHDSCKVMLGDVAIDLDEEVVARLLARYIDTKHGGRMLGSCINLFYVECAGAKDFIGILRLFCEKYAKFLMCEIKIKTVAGKTSKQQFICTTAEKVDPITLQTQEEKQQSVDVLEKPYSSIGGSLDTNPFALLQSTEALSPVSSGEKVADMLVEHIDDHHKGRMPIGSIGRFISEHDSVDEVIGEIKTFCENHSEVLYLEQNTVCTRTAVVTTSDQQRAHDKTVNGTSVHSTDTLHTSNSPDVNNASNRPACESERFNASRGKSRNAANSHSVVLDDCNNSTPQEADRHNCSQPTDADQTKMSNDVWTANGEDARTTPQEEFKKSINGQAVCDKWWSDVSELLHGPIVDYVFRYTHMHGGNFAVVSALYSESQQPDTDSELKIQSDPLLQTPDEMDVCTDTGHLTHSATMRKRTAEDEWLSSLFPPQLVYLLRDLLAQKGGTGTRLSDVHADIGVYNHMHEIVACGRTASSLRFEKCLAAIGGVTMREGLWYSEPYDAEVTHMWTRYLLHEGAMFLLFTGELCGDSMFRSICTIDILERAFQTFYELHGSQLLDTSGFKYEYNYFRCMLRRLRIWGVLELSNNWKILWREEAIENFIEEYTKPGLFSIEESSKPGLVPDGNKVCTVGATHYCGVILETPGAASGDMTEDGAAESVANHDEGSTAVPHADESELGNARLTAFGVDLSEELERTARQSDELDVLYGQVDSLKRKLDGYLATTSLPGEGEVETHLPVEDQPELDAMLGRDVHLSGVEANDIAESAADIDASTHDTPVVQTLGASEANAIAREAVCNETHTALDCASIETLQCSEDGVRSDAEVQHAPPDVLDGNNTNDSQQVGTAECLETHVQAQVQIAPTEMNGVTDSADRKESSSVAEMDGKEIQTDLQEVARDGDGEGAIALDNFNAATAIFQSLGAHHVAREESSAEPPQLSQRTPLLPTNTSDTVPSDYRMNDSERDCREFLRYMVGRYVSNAHWPVTDHGVQALYKEYRSSCGQHILGTSAPILEQLKALRVKSKSGKKMCALITGNHPYKWTANGKRVFQYIQMGDNTHLSKGETHATPATGQGGAKPVKRAVMSNPSNNHIPLQAMVHKHKQYKASIVNAPPDPRAFVLVNTPHHLSTAAHHLIAHYRHHVSVLQQTPHHSTRCRCVPIRTHSNSGGHSPSYTHSRVEGDTHDLERSSVSKRSDECHSEDSDGSDSDPTTAHNMTPQAIYQFNTSGATCDKCAAELDDGLKPLLALDCEGVPEHLLLLQLGTDVGVWVFDCVVLGAESVCTYLRPLLEDTNVLKLVHDAHCDAYALRRWGGVQLTAVLDTQVAYEVEQTHARYVKESSNGDSGAYIGTSTSTTTTTEDPYILSIGLSRLLERHALIHPYKKDMHQRMNNDANLWQRRPLDQRSLEYAAADVSLLLQLGAILRDQLRYTISSICNTPRRSRGSLGGDILSVPESGNDSLWAITARASDLRATWAAESGHPGARAVAFDVGCMYQMRSREVLSALSPATMAHLTPTHVEERDITTLIQMIPKDCLGSLHNPANWLGLTDVVLDLGRRPIAFYGKRRDFLVDEIGGDDPEVETESKKSVVLSQNLLVTRDHLDEVVASVGGESQFGDDNRAGLNGSLHRISALRSRRGDIVGVTMRAGRTVSGSVGMISDLLFATDKAILIMGEPGAGKTTVIREIARALSEHTNLLIVDTSNEIAGDGDVPHECIGHARRVQVPSLDQQSRVLVEVVQNHTPEVMIIDEIGRASEVAAARTVRQRGVRILASAHGDLRKLNKNAQLSGLLGHKEHVIKTGGVPKTIRVGEPTFDIVIELKTGSYNEWVVVMNAGRAVDRILEGQTYPIQRRRRCATTGRVSIEYGQG